MEDVPDVAVHSIFTYCFLVPLLRFCLRDLAPLIHVFPSFSVHWISWEFIDIGSICG